MENKKSGKWKRILSKALFVQIAFLILHYSYDFFPHTITQIFSGTSEAVWEHMKIAFYSFGFVSLIEYLIHSRKKTDHASYGFAVLAATLFYCWPMFILFFTPPAIFGQYPNDVFEIISANIVLYSTSVFVIIIESTFESAKQTTEFRWAISILFVILVSIFTIYSFCSPWCDVFAIPPGWE